MRKEILDEAKAEAEDIVKSANRKVENTIRTIKESQAAKEETRKARSELQDFVSALASRKEQDRKDREGYLEQKIKQVSERQRRQRTRKDGKMSEEERRKLAEQEDNERRIAEFRSGPLRVGEKIRVKSNGMVGEVAIVSDKAVTVIVGNIKSKMPLDKVERITSNEFKSAVKSEIRPAAPVQGQDSISERKLNFKMELDVRGQRVNEALENVMHYIDDAIMVNVQSVRIIHGKGTGALREEIQKYLRAMPGVSSARDESIQLGGSGVTVVTFNT